MPSISMASIFLFYLDIYDALLDLVPFVQFKKREKNTHGTKLTLLHGCFSRFLNCTNGTKSRNAPHIYTEKIWR